MFKSCRPCVQPADSAVNNSIVAGGVLPSVGQSPNSSISTAALLYLGDLGGPNNPTQAAPPFVTAAAGLASNAAYPPGTVGVPQPYLTAETQATTNTWAFAVTPDGTGVYVCYAHVYLYSQSGGVWNSGATPSPQPSPMSTCLAMVSESAGWPLVWFSISFKSSTSRLGARNKCLGQTTLSCI
jgi:hypothetical protein